MPAGASMRNLGKPTICSSNSNVASTPRSGVAVAGSSHTPSPRAAATDCVPISNEPGMRTSNQSAGSRVHFTRPECARLRAARTVSRQSGICRMRSAASSGAMRSTVSADQW